MSTSGQPQYGDYSSQNPQDPDQDYAPASWAMESNDMNKVAPWALGLAIVSVVLLVSFLGTGFAWIPAIVALILSIIAVVKAKKINGPGRRMGMSVTSLVLSIITLLISIGIIVAIVWFLNTPEMQECLRQGTPERMQECFEQLGQ